MQTKTFVRGQNCFVEGEEVKDIIFLEEGEFETTKKIYIKKNQENKVICQFKRMESYKDKTFVEKLLDPDSKVS